MSKQFFYDEDARARVLAGAEIVYKAVSTTLGPKGKNIIIGKNYGHPTVTHDGVTVARATEITDTPETLGYKAGADLIKSASEKLLKMAGDGTSSVVVLTYSILSEAHRLIAAGYNPMELRKGLEAASKPILERLSEMSEDIASDSKKVSEVATISAGDKEIGDLIAEIISEIGKDGIITVEEGQGLKLEKEIVKGFTFEKGFISPYMVTDQVRMEAVLDNVPVLVTDYKIRTVQQLIPLLEGLSKQGQKELLIICDDVDSEVLQFLVLNKMKDTFRALVVKNPSFGDQRKETLIDIATLTGATFVTEDQGYRLDELNYELGHAQKVITTSGSTTIIEGKGIKEDIDSRIEQIKTQARESKDSYAKERYENRAAALGSSVALIKVGGVTEEEIEEKKFRVDDAVAATKAALAEGIVPGGGIVLLNLAKEMKTETPSETILYNALRKPFFILMQNAALSAEEYIHAINKETGKGIDVNHPEKGLIDMKKNGIIDPTRVTREAILNAVSIAGTAMTMGGLIVDEPEEQKPMLPPQMGMRP